MDIMTFIIAALFVGATIIAISITIKIRRIQNKSIKGKNGKIVGRDNIKGENVKIVGRDNIKGENVKIVGRDNIINNLNISERNELNEKPQQNEQNGSSQTVAAWIVENTSSKRKKTFDSLLSEAVDGDEIWILGTGVTTFLRDPESVEGYLKGNKHIKILLMNTDLLKKNEKMSYCKKMLAHDIGKHTAIKSVTKPYCDIRKCNFLVRQRHLNKYYKRPGYAEEIQLSRKLITKYKKSRKDNNWSGTIEAKQFCSFIPMSITAIKTQATNKRVLIEYIVPFTDKRILFEGSKDKNKELYNLFVEYLDDAWENSEGLDFTS